MTDQHAGGFPDHFLREDGRRTATVNERIIMALLSRHGAASRADLARLTRLAPHSITRLVDPLLERGLLREGAPHGTGRGKPSAPLSLDPLAAFSIGLSVMTDAVSIVLLDLTGQAREARSARLDDIELTPALGQIGAMIDDAIRAAGWDRNRLVGIGVGVTGYFIGQGTRLNPPRLLDPWALVPLDTIIADQLGTPAWVDNDGNVAAIGEALLGVGRTARDFAYLYFSAGFGGGVVSGGKPLRGSNGNAGEFASIIPQGWPQPTLEALRRSMAAHGRRHADVYGMLQDFDASSPGVREWLDASEPSLNLVASAISATLDPDMIVFGGRLPPSLSRLVIPRIHFTNPERRGHHRPVPRIVTSPIAGDATAIGAATLPLRAAFFDHAASDA